MVSIIVPFYNSEESIEKCATSIFNQSYRDLEFIFINDGSTDNSLNLLNNVIKQYAVDDARIKIINREINYGVSSARNIGLLNSKGDYIAFIDSDDYIKNNTISDFHDIAKANLSDLVWSDYLVVPENDHNSTIYTIQNVPNDPAECINKILTGGLHAGLWNKLFKRDICVKHNILFHENIIYCEDTIFLIEYLHYTNRIDYISKAYYYYVLRSSLTDNPVKSRNNYNSRVLVAKLMNVDDFPLINSEILLIHKARLKKDIAFSGEYSFTEFENLFPESDPYIGNILKSKFEKLLMWSYLEEYMFLYNLLLFINRAYMKLKQNIHLQLNS